MTDSTDNTKELDQYGVWVKKPPLGASGEAATAPDDFNLDTDLPDFSFLDKTDDANKKSDTDGTFQEADTALSADELSNITGSLDMVTETTDGSAPAAPESAAPVEEEKTADSEEEISLDSFMDGGFSDGSAEIAAHLAAKGESTPKPAEPETRKEPSEPASDESSVSLDEFLDEPAAEPEQVPAEETTVPEEAPLDINLDFSNTATDDTVLDTPEEAKPAESSEEISISEFTDAPASSDTGTAVDLDHFDDTFNSVEDSRSSVAASAESAGTTEEVDLSDFGIGDTPAPAEKTEDAPAEKAKPAASAQNDYNLTVSADDSSSADDTTAAPAAGMTVSSGDDFNVDNVMNSVEDTDGKTTCIGSQEDAVVHESAADVPVVSEVQKEENIVPETIEDMQTTSSVIPDSELNGIPQTLGDDSSTSAATSAPEQDNEILNKIVSELSSLRSEISSLKEEFQVMKNSPAHSADIIAPEKAELKDSGGFFSTDDDDDTIALSGDELDNILNNADFTKTAADENAEPSDTNSDSADTAAAEETPAAEENAPAESVSDHSTTVTDSAIFGEDKVPDQLDIQDDFDSEPPESLKMDFSTDNLEEPVIEDIDVKEDTDGISPELPEEISIPKTDDILVESSSTDLMDSGDSDAAAAKADTPELVGSPDDLFPKEPSISEALTDDKIDYLSADKNVVTDSEAEAVEEPAADTSVPENETKTDVPIPSDLKTEIKSVLSYMDQLLENLPEDKITEFAQSEQFDTYKKLFKELGLA